MEFKHAFTVDAPVATVAEFHGDTSALKKLTPFPIIAQIHQYEPLAEGSNAHFTLWFGPMPVRWHAVHTEVRPNGFVDTQVNGPLKAWRHTHRFIALSPDKTRVEDLITYSHKEGIRGLLTRMLFSGAGLWFLFTARKFLTRRGVARLLDERQVGQSAG